MAITNIPSALNAVTEHIKAFDGKREKFQNDIQADIEQRRPTVSEMTIRGFELAQEQVPALRMLNEDLIKNLPENIVRALEDMHSTATAAITEPPPALEQPAQAETAKTTPSSTGNR